MLTLERFEDATEKLNNVIMETKLVYSDYFTKQTGNKQKQTKTNKNKQKNGRIVENVS